MDEKSFLKFIAEPSVEKYLELRRRLLKREDFQPYSTEMLEIVELMNAGKYREAVECFERGLKNLILSPGANLLISSVHEKLGEKDVAEFHRHFAFAIMTCILESGDGSEEAPYLVTRVSDEYDVLEVLDKKMVHQQLVEDIESGRLMDVLECSDGSTVYFDVTEIYPKASKPWGADEG